eukprot:scaffold10593_cov48-Attheya_sp.AAC.2
MNTKEAQVYEGDNFITEEEMKRNRKEGEEKIDMEGIETVIQKKRALSIEEENEANDQTINKIRKKNRRQSN